MRRSLIKNKKPLIEIVKMLEGRTNEERCAQTLEILTFGSFIPYLDSYKLRFSKGNNIILKINEGNEEILVTGHYDAVKGSPGANDNASCIAVIYGFLKKISGDPEFNKSIRIVIFDEEENGLKGSRGYIKKHGISNIKALINMELVGSGDTFIIWPVNSSNSVHNVISALESSADEISFKIQRGERFSRFIGDHQPFLNAGVAGSVCLSLVSGKDAEIIDWYASQRSSKTFEQETDCRIPGIFEIYHSPSDLSEKLSEASMEAAAELLYRAVKKL